MKILPVYLFIGLLFLGCTPASAPTVSFKLTPAETAPPPTSTPIINSKPIVSPTAIQLPFNSQVSQDEYCRPPYAFLQVGDNSDISEEEIVYELTRVWLKRYASPDAPLFCRIDEFTIDKVYNEPELYTNALEPKGDFMRVIVFSVKLLQTPTDWMSFAGELDQQNWLHISHIVAISRVSDGYQLEFAYP